MPYKPTLDSGEETQADATLIERRVLGRNEMAPEAFFREINLSASVVYSFARCCNFRQNFPSSMGDEQRGALLDKAYIWLSEHTTGPWFWNQDADSRLRAGIYIERTTDKEAFRHFSSRFRFEEPDGWLDQVAVLRGVLPPPTADECFSIWADEHRGFHSQLIVDSRRRPRLRIAFERPEIEREFLDEWAGAFCVMAGKRGVYISRPFGDGSLENSGVLTRWLINHRGVGEIIPAGESSWQVTGNKVTQLPSPDDRWEISIRYPSIMAELRASPWGAVFEPSQTNPKHVFAHGRSPAFPHRPIPADFQAYLDGKSEGYAVISGPASGGPSRPPRLPRGQGRGRKSPYPDAA
jgi:hypothetical protein